MTFTVVPPPQNQDRFGEVGVKLIEAAHKLGMQVDPEGMLRAWAMDATKILIENEGDDIKGMAFMAVGPRWVDSTVQASIIEYRDPSGGLLIFARTIAQAFNATGLFYEDPEPITQEGNRTEYRVIREELR